jgi:protein-disulfide isomerase
MAVTVLLQAVTLLTRSGNDSAARNANPQRPTVTEAPEGASIDLAGMPIEGQSDAKIALVEFSDYECPYCARHATGVGKQVKQEFVTTGKVLHAFANNPLAMHSNAKMLATAAICAGEQGRFWVMHDALFDKKPKSQSDVSRIASEMKLDAGKFEICFDAEAPARRIEEDLAKANEFQLTGTPGFAVGKIDKGRVLIQKFILGAQPFAVFEKALNEAISNAD